VLLDEALEGEGGVETVEFELEGFLFGFGSDVEVVIFIGLLVGVDDIHNFGESGDKDLEMLISDFMLDE
jgi:hypothetical protein